MFVFQSNNLFVLGLAQKIQRINQTRYVFHLRIRQKCWPTHRGLQQRRILITLSFEYDVFLLFLFYVFFKFMNYSNHPASATRSSKQMSFNTFAACHANNFQEYDFSGVFITGFLVVTQKARV